MPFRVLAKPSNISDRNPTVRSLLGGVVGVCLLADLLVPPLVAH